MNKNFFSYALFYQMSSAISRLQHFFQTSKVQSGVA